MTTIEKSILSDTLFNVSYPGITAEVWLDISYPEYKGADQIRDMLKKLFIEETGIQSPKGEMSVSIKYWMLSDEFEEVNSLEELAKIAMYVEGIEYSDWEAYAAAALLDIPISEVADRYLGKYIGWDEFYNAMDDSPKYDSETNYWHYNTGQNHIEEYKERYFFGR